MTLEEHSRRVAWDVFAASLLGLNNHPGQTKGDARRMTLEEIADMADAMLEIRDRRFKAVTDGSWIPFYPDRKEDDGPE